MKAVSFYYKKENRKVIDIIIEHPHSVDAFTLPLHHFLFDTYRFL